MSDSPKVYYVKAQGNQYERPVYYTLSDDDYIDLTLPGEDRWIATIIQTVPPYTNAVSSMAKWLDLVKHEDYTEVLKERDELKQKLVVAIKAMELAARYMGSDHDCSEKWPTNIREQCQYCYESSIVDESLKKIKPDGREEK